MTSSADRPLKFGIVAGELSGDQLGADLIHAIKRQHPNSVFTGIGGPAMIKAGCQSLFPMERLSVMGIFAVLGRIRELLQIRNALKTHFSSDPPDVFIGVDSPDFNLPLAGFLKKNGIKTAHYVSPTVWAWRQNRIHKIRRDVDLMLTLLPFEADFYRRFNVPVKFVGHPFASVIDPDIDYQRAKRHWGFAPKERIIAVLPGSRGGELKYMGPLFLQVMQKIHRLEPDCRFVVPLANQHRRVQFESMLNSLEVTLPVSLIDGHAREIMAGADFVLATSGTITLEAMLLKRPMVVAYRWGKLTHLLLSRFVHTEYIALPNLLAKEEIVPEFLQYGATVENITNAVMELMTDNARCEQMGKRFDQLHRLLNLNASQVAAEEILSLINIDTTSQVQLHAS